MSGKGKRRRTDYFLPPLDSILKQTVSRKTCFMESNLQDFDFRREFCMDIPETGKICWVIAQYSFDVVMKIIHCEAILPVGLTEKQHNNIVSSRAGVSIEDADFVSNFIRNQCPSLGRAFKGASFEKVLGPPTSMCYKCSCDLVQYHQCHVRCFSTSGFEHAMKITLRCLHCGLFYNYAQFGNKREVGFRFYQEPREYNRGK